jgi:ABC-type spermidine/putrescine transport system permease subunit I
MFQTMDPQPLKVWVKCVLTLWFLLLVVWPAALMGAGMSGEGGGNRSAVLALLCCVLSYPVLLFVAFVFRRRRPMLVLLPALSFAFGFLAGSLI